MIGVGNNIRRVALYIHVRLTLGIIARIVATIRAVVVHVCKLRWHLVKLVVSDGSGIGICYRIWYGLGMETISMVLISLDHVEQGIEGRPGVWKLEVWVDSAKVSLYEKQVGIVGERIRAYYDIVETIGVGADGLP